MHQHVHYMHTNMYIPQGDSFMLYTVVFQPCHALYITYRPCTRFVQALYKVVPALYKVVLYRLVHVLYQAVTRLVYVWYMTCTSLVQGWYMLCTRLLHDWYMPGT